MRPWPASLHISGGGGGRGASSIVLGKRRGVRSGCGAQRTTNATDYNRLHQEINYVAQSIQCLLELQTTACGSVLEALVAGFAVYDGGGPVARAGAPSALLFRVLLAAHGICLSCSCLEANPEPGAWGLELNALDSETRSLEPEVRRHRLTQSAPRACSAEFSYEELFQLGYAEICTQSRNGFEGGEG